MAIGGKLSNNSFVDKEGNKHYRLEVEAEWIERIHKPKKQDADESDEDSLSDVDDSYEIDNIENVDVTQMGTMDDGLVHETIELPKGQLSINDVKKPKGNRKKK